MVSHSLQMQVLHCCVNTGVREWTEQKLFVLRRKTLLEFGSAVPDCVNMNIWICTQLDDAFCLLPTLSFKVWLDKGSQGWQGWEPLQGWAWQRCYFKTLRQTLGDGVFVRICVCVRSSLTRAEKDKRSCLLFSLEARGSGWFWGCVSGPSWCFSPSCWTARREAGTEIDPTPFCWEEIALCLKSPSEEKVLPLDLQ